MTCERISVTAQLVQRTFVLEELGFHEFKGVADPMMLYAVVTSREIDYDDHEAMMTGGFAALVGCDEEIGLLLPMGAEQRRVRSGSADRWRSGYWDIQPGGQLTGPSAPRGIHSGRLSVFALLYEQSALSGHGSVAAPTPMAP